MAARGSKAQLVRIITEFETRQAYNAILYRDWQRAVLFDWSRSRTHIELVLSRLSIDELKSRARYAELCLGPMKLEAGAPAKPLTLEDFKLLYDVLRRVLEGFSIRSACRTIAAQRRKGKKVSAGTLEKRYRDALKKRNAIEAEYLRHSADFRAVLKKAREMEFIGSD